jgi:hypothetical protein
MDMSSTFLFQNQMVMLEREVGISFEHPGIACFLQGSGRPTLNIRILTDLISYGFGNGTSAVCRLQTTSLGTRSPILAQARLILGKEGGAHDFH